MGMRSNRLYVRIFCSLGVVNMLDRKVYTKSVGGNLEFFCSKAEGLRIVRLRNESDAERWKPTRKPRTDTISTKVSADSLLKPAISIA